jgi:hypothetical protein
MQKRKENIDGYIKKNNVHFYKMYSAALSSSLI